MKILLLFKASQRDATIAAFVNVKQAGFYSRVQEKP